MTSRRRYPLSRAHHIPLRRQLAADLEAGIRDGHIAPGSKLPSSRDLARHLDVDRGTVQAAIARLRRRGLLQTGRGRRPRVPGWRLSDRRRLLDAIADEQEARAIALEVAGRGLRQAFWRGVPRDVFLRELYDVAWSGWGEDETPDVALYEPCPALRAALAAEIRASCGVEVFPVTRPRHFVECMPILVRAEIFFRFRRPDRGAYIPLSLAGGTRERGIVRRKVRSGLVVLLSGSETVRDYATELAAREFERGVSFVALDPDRRDEVVRAAAAARLVFYDRLSADRIPPGVARAVPIDLIAGADIEALRRHLSPGGHVLRAALERR